MVAHHGATWPSHLVIKNCMTLMHSGWNTWDTLHGIQTVHLMMEANSLKIPFAVDEVRPMFYIHSFAANQFKNPISFQLGSNTHTHSLSEYA